MTEKYVESAAEVPVPAHLEARHALVPAHRTARARDLLRGCDVFAKLAVGADACDALRNEWLLLNRLAPGYFPRPVEFKYLSSERAYLTTEYLAGESFLKSPLVKNEKVFFQIVQQALRGLAVLHSAGYVHGDVRPQNLMVGGHDTEAWAMWTDLEHAVRVGSLDAGGMFVGGFHDPTLADGGAQSARTDLFAFGQTLLERIPNEEEIASGWGESLLKLAEVLCDPSPVDCLHDADRAAQHLDNLAQTEGIATMPPIPRFQPPMQVINMEARRAWEANWRRWTESTQGFRLGVTGPPRCGKTTFLRGMTSQLALDGHSVLDLLPGGVHGGPEGVDGTLFESFVAESQKMPVVLLDSADARAFVAQQRSALKQPVFLIIESSGNQGTLATDEQWQFPIFSERRWYQWVTASI